MGQESEAERMLRAQRAAQVGKPRSKALPIIIGVLVVLFVIGALSEKKEGQTQASTNIAKPPIDAAPEPQKTLEAPAALSAPVAAEPEESLTGQQMQAVRTAKDYLDMTGFSRKGLINQLSSDAGDGFAVADATAAVDSLDVDWNEQAARTAKSYLDMTGFSCKGLVQQLSSSSGDNYTQEQASHGARQAGAC